MQEIYRQPVARDPQQQQSAAALTERLCAQLPLTSAALRSWQHLRLEAERPKVSVIIPTYNRPTWLGPTLACVMRQSLGAIEAVVVDDGSKEAETVRRVTESFSPMARYIRTENRGEPAAVNRGIEEARGEYLAFLSDDDAFAPDLLTAAVAALEANPDAIGCYPDWDIVDTSGCFVEAHKLPEFDRRMMLRAHWCLPGPGTVLSRAVARAVGGRDLSLRWVSDFDLWLRATAYGRLVHIPRTLAYWRLHATNLTGSERRVERAQERVTLIEKFFSDSAEQARSGQDRDRAFAAAHFAAAAIAGPTDPEIGLEHLRKAKRFDPELIRELPPNMLGYPDVWPAGYQEVFRPDQTEQAALVGRDEQ
jgi:hypothetical protein